MSTKNKNFRVTATHLYEDTSYSYTTSDIDTAFEHSEVLKLYGFLVTIEVVENGEKP